MFSKLGGHKQYDELEVWFHRSGGNWFLSEGEIGGKKCHLIVTLKHKISRIERLPCLTAVDVSFF